jgi:glucose-6-phosphate isomerase
MRVLPVALSIVLFLHTPHIALADSRNSSPSNLKKQVQPQPMMRSSWHLKSTDVPQFDALQAAAHAFQTDDKLHLRNLCNDSSRCAGLVAYRNSMGPSSGPSQYAQQTTSTATTIDPASIVNSNRRIILDYSRQQVTGETMELLFDLADAVGFTDRRAAMENGLRINTTEDRAVLHHVLRMPRDYIPDNPTIANSLAQVHLVRDGIAEFTDQIRSGAVTGATGKPFKNVVSIGIGGSSLGPECVMEALRADPQAAKASHGRVLRFLANVDPVDFFTKTQDLDPEETLVIIVSKTFGTAETMLNARTARKWLVHHLMRKGAMDSAQVVSQHMVAVSSNVERCQDFGISASRVFRFWDWVGGRFSVCSAVGLVPLSLHYSTAVMDQFLDGAHDVDQHFFKSPLRDNIPVLLGLLGVWNSTFLGYGVRALLPYSQALNRFPALIQQVDMESNGKRVALDGIPLLHTAGEITFGEPGTNGQHSFYQLLHQGRVVPADFIGFMESQQPVDLGASEAHVSNHDELMSNFFAQPDALAYGKTMTDLVQEGVPEDLRAHMVFDGNRPSSSILMTKLDAFSAGQLLALYEHRTAVQGFIWGINSFDQWGVELGKVLAKQVQAQLSASRKQAASVQGFNSSTSSLLEAYLAHGRK